MASMVQTSLFDLPVDGLGLGPLGGMVTRQVLGRGAWVDLLPGWLSGADALFDELLTRVPWQAERRQMYERLVDVPRLLCFYGERDPLPTADLVTARESLNAHYAPELGEPFATAGLCLYRDGRDSVAWHGDTIGRGKVEDTMVAIVSLGSPRHLMLRPRGGGATIRHQLGHGDLIVMGGSCQRTWEHAIPKTSKPVGPRISVQFRPHGVR
ncbi:alpha-ketoglutarate-dependent dioxygenase AlkB [uncultured Friedmanniella sp.]|uniref:alpha-ketoglutarate-dependent dioxygenase AlkB n=1 Tax=uncultured Friedmanniella sp. TaxID=335381 RepID=UPI0035CB3CA2